MLHIVRASSYERGNLAGSVTGTNSVVFDGDEIQETQPKWWNVNLYCSRLSQLCGVL